MAVRVINEAMLGGPVDVYLMPPGGTASTASPLVRDLGFGSAGAYEHVPADKAYTVVVVPTGSTSRKAAGLGNVTVSGASGAVRTVIISDNPAKSSKPAQAPDLSDYDAP